MIAIYTYEDLQKIGDSDEKRMNFILSVISAHKQSPAYAMAVKAGLYYNGENPTINNYQKIVIDTLGKQHLNTTAANYKIASHFLKFAIRQKCSYLLGNGVSFAKEDTKAKLGESFDRVLMRIAKASKIEGVCFGFWNLNHVERFKYTEFAPLYGEENGALMAGVRFWRLADDKPERITLFEIDGYTDYIRGRKGSTADMEILHPKRPYKTVTHSSIAEGEKILLGKNYPSFPIVPLKNGSRCKSELNGRQNTIDAYDLLSSSMVNNVDEASIIYWLIQNAGGMDETDDANYLAQLLRTHVAHVENDANITPHQLEAPVDASQAALDMLNRRLYQDFSCFDESAVTAGRQTATAIQASYTPLDLDTDDFEGYVSEFVSGILALAGIDDAPSYTRSPLINRGEEIQNLVTAGSYLPGEYITKKILEIEGDADKAEEILRQLDGESMDGMGGAVNAEIEQS